MVFSGWASYQMDSKGRVVVPAAFARRMRGRLMLVRAPGRHLLLMERDAWEALVRCSDSESWREYWTSGAVAVDLKATPPGSVRVLVPYDQRQYAGLAPLSAVVFAGVGAAVRISTPQQWERWSADLEALVLSIVEEKANGG